MFCDAHGFIGRYARIAPGQTSHCRKSFLRAGSFYNWPVLYWLGGSTVYAFQLCMRQTFPVHPFSGRLLQENRSLTIKLRKRKPAKKVEWSSDTVDNEHLGRRSSKCEQCTDLFCPITPCHYLDTCKYISLNCAVSYSAEPACSIPDMLSGSIWHMELLFPVVTNLLTQSLEFKLCSRCMKRFVHSSSHKENHFPVLRNKIVRASLHTKSKQHLCMCTFMCNAALADCKTWTRWQHISAVCLVKYTSGLSAAGWRME